VIGYEAAEWHDLYVAVAGAAAALTGLLFVAMSINLARILELAILTSRAAESLGILVIVLLVSILVLTPGQSRELLGTELAVIEAATVAVLCVRLCRRERRPGDPLYWTLTTFGIALLSTVPSAVGGLSLAIGTGGGLYWLVPGLVFSFVGAVYNGWVLLVEILR
jgi:hypothetical protein